MPISRIDLADEASPERLVIKILKHEILPVPVPIENLCGKLDIVSINPLDTDGFEGGLLTQAAKENGIILYNKNSNFRRRRFTIAHELGHFLMPSHIPDQEGKFLCSLSDMFSLAKDETDRRLRMEAEANRFASQILLPVSHFRNDARLSKYADLAEVVRLADKYQVSNEALGRGYLTYRDERIALIIAHERQVIRIHKEKNRFPFIDVRVHAPVPTQSLLMRRRHDIGFISQRERTDAGVWIDVKWGTRAPIMHEQVLLQGSNYALILLTLEDDEDEYDPDENRTAKQRYQARMNRP